MLAGNRGRRGRRGFARRRPRASRHAGQVRGRRGRHPDDRRGGHRANARRTPRDTRPPRVPSPEVAGSSVLPSSPWTRRVGLGHRPRRRGCRRQPDQLPAGNITDGDPQHPSWLAKGNGRGVTLTLTLPQPRAPDRGPGGSPATPRWTPAMLSTASPRIRRVCEVRRRFDGGTHRRPVVRRQPDHAGHRRRHDHQLGDHRNLSTRRTPDHDYVPISEVLLSGPPSELNSSREPGVTPDQVTAEEPDRHAAPGIPSGRRGGRAARGLGRAGRLTRSGG